MRFIVAIIFILAFESLVSAQCPGGVCPPRQPVRSIVRAASIPVQSVGRHWTFPGDIASHLANGHGQSVAGLSREQMLNLHDSLHEGRTVSQPKRSAQRVGVIRRFFRR
jgi:hypothetical protein